MFKSICLAVLIFMLMSVIGISGIILYDMENTSIRSTKYMLVQEKVSQNENINNSMDITNKISIPKYNHINNKKLTLMSIKLEKKNSLVLKGVITDKSVALLQNKLMILSNKLPSNTPIFLVLDTPGGSVFAGMSLIDNIKAIPQPVFTITLLAASMGFQIAQALDARFVTSSGIYMSHRASVSSFAGGQFDGEFETRYNMMKQKIDYLDSVAAARMGISLKYYKKIVKDEYWVHGFQAKNHRVADHLARVYCGKSMQNQHEEIIRTMFGPVSLMFSDCPLIRYPLAVNVQSISKENRKQVFNIINMLYKNPREFIKQYIVTNNYQKIFKK